MFINAYDKVGAALGAALVKTGEQAKAEADKAEKAYRRRLARERSEKPLVQRPFKGLEGLLRKGVTHG